MLRRNSARIQQMLSIRGRGIRAIYIICNSAELAPDLVGLYLILFVFVFVFATLLRRRLRERDARGNPSHITIHMQSINDQLHVRG